MEGLKLIPYLGLVLCIAGVILGAVAITQSKFGDSMDKCCNTLNYTIHSSGDYCYNSTSDPGACGQDNLNLSDEYYSIWQSQDGIQTIAEQQPTVAIISVMVIIISIIAGVFVYMKFFS